MKKIFFLIIAIFAFIGFSCNEYETMQEKLKKEKKAIDSFIDKNDFVILKEYPKNGVFKEKEYFRNADGLYIHVVDSGSARRVTPYVDEVQVRFDYYLTIKEYVKNDSTGKYLGEYADFPIEFIYGNSASYSRDKYGLSCDGWAIPLNYVGEGAIVDLIVPSSMAGSSYNSSFSPLFFKGLHYTTFF